MQLAQVGVAHEAQPSLIFFMERAPLTMIAASRVRATHDDMETGVRFSPLFFVVIVLSDIGFTTQARTLTGCTAGQLSSMQSRAARART